MPDLAILLGLHEEDRFLGAQLDSLAAQSWTDWMLIASDDGMTRRARTILADFAQRIGPDRVQVLAGPKGGAARNYLLLFQHVPADCRYVALCDQDDVWLPRKLSRAVAVLQATSTDRPAALFGARMVCNQDLGRSRPTAMPRRPPGFRNALVQNIMPGNTIVMNAAAARLCAATAARAGGIVAHDWWVYQLVTGAAGQVLADPEPAVLYRQHDRNLIGAGLGLRAALLRATLALRGRHRQWNGAQLQALSAVSLHFSLENQQVLARFAELRTAPFFTRLRIFAALGLYRQTRAGQAMLWLQTMLGRV
jgi:glycosyltransferase involved in cell wall biosynthesis